MSAFTLGDVAIGGEYSYSEIIRPDGTHVSHKHWTNSLGQEFVVNGQAFDNDGNLYAALGVLTAGVYVRYDNEPHDVVWIPNTSQLLTIVATTNTTAHLKRYTTAGVLINTYGPINTDSGWTAETQRLKVDIACDGHTVYYTDQGRTVFSYDITGSGTQLTNWDQLPVDSHYVYNAFKLLQNTSPQEIISNMSTSGNGPYKALCIDGDTDKHWTEELFPTSDYHVYRRSNANGDQSLSYVVKLNPSNVNDKIWSLACYYTPCGGRAVHPTVCLVGAT